MDQELFVCPTANIESNVPEDLDLFSVINEIDSDPEEKMEAAADTTASRIQKNVEEKGTASEEIVVRAAKKEEHNLSIDLQSLQMNEKKQTNAEVSVAT